MKTEKSVIRKRALINLKDAIKIVITNTFCGFSCESSSIRDKTIKDKIRYIDPILKKKYKPEFSDWDHLPTYKQELLIITRHGYYVESGYHNKNKYTYSSHFVSHSLIECIRYMYFGYRPGPIGVKSKINKRFLNYDNI